MREFTDEYIMSLIKKNRNFFISDLEESVCLECYNLLRSLNLTENDVEFKESICKLCNKKKLCINNSKIYKL